MQRIMIVGGPGSGKSTLALRLGEVTGLPVFHMDHIHWLPGWVERSQPEKSRLSREVHAKDRWIFEGNHSRTYADRVARADTLIWLDLPLTLRVWRVLRRSFTYLGKSRPDLPEGCPEQLNGQTLEFLGFIWRTRQSARIRIQSIKDDPPDHLRVIHLRSRAQVAAFLTTFAASN